METPRAQLLKIADVSATTNLSRTTIYRLEGLGEFPPPLKLGRSVRWRASDIDAWLEQHPTKRSGNAN